MKTNKQLAKEMYTTPRQISKSRKRGWIWIHQNGQLIKKVKFRAPLIN